MTFETSPPPASFDATAKFTATSNKSDFISNLRESISTHLGRGVNWLRDNGKDILKITAIAVATFAVITAVTAMMSAAIILLPEPVTIGIICGVAIMLLFPC